MAGKQSVWQWLSNSKNQKTLAWLGGGLAIVISGAWQGYLHFSEQPKNNPTLTVGDIASGRDTNISGPFINNSPNATINIGITPEQYEAGLKRREQEVRTELAQANAADKDKIALLEKQLADIQGKLQNPDKALEEYKAKLADGAVRNSVEEPLRLTAEFDAGTKCYGLYRPVHRCLGCAIAMGSGGHPVRA